MKKKRGERGGLQQRRRRHGGCLGRHVADAHAPAASQNPRVHARTRSLHGHRDKPRLARDGARYGVEQVFPHAILNKSTMRSAAPRRSSALKCFVAVPSDEVQGMETRALRLRVWEIVHCGGSWCCCCCFTRPRRFLPSLPGSTGEVEDEGGRTGKWCVVRNGHASCKGHVQMT